MKYKFLPALHPFLLAISPVLFLYSRNINILDVGQFAGAFLSILGFMAAIELILRIIIKNPQRRWMVMSCCVAFLFIYSNFVTYLISHFSLTIPRNSTVFLLAWLVPLAGAIFILFRFPNNILPKLNTILTVFAVCLVSFSMVNIIAAIPQHYKLSKYGIQLPDRKPLAVYPNRPEFCPNIYVLISDQHVGDSCLQKYGYDNSAFINALESRGFYVARQSHSNYWATHLSIASFLNYDYLDLPHKTETAYNMSQYLDWIRNNNRAFAFLKHYGYTTVQCRTDFQYRFDEVNTADIQLMPDPWYRGILSMELLANTPFYSLLSKGFDIQLPIDQRDMTTSLLRRDILKAVEKTKAMAHVEKPFILFTHILAPHGPNCFNENGDFPDSPSRFDNFDPNFCPPGKEKELRKYLADMNFIDKKMVEIVEYILKNSKTPPVIILQGDHGNRFWVNNGGTRQQVIPEIFSILNAVYLPGCDYKSVLYPSISSVNTFRVIFNQYFGANYPLLPDRSFYAPALTPDPEEVTQYLQQEK
jgi:hypothetical protein